MRTSRLSRRLKGGRRREGLPFLSCVCALQRGALAPPVRSERGCVLAGPHTSALPHRGSPCICDLREVGSHPDHMSPEAPGLGPEPGTSQKGQRCRMESGRDFNGRRTSVSFLRIGAHAHRPLCCLGFTMLQLLLGATFPSEEHTGRAVFSKSINGLHNCGTSKNSKIPLLVKIASLHFKQARGKQKQATRLSILRGARSTPAFPSLQSLRSVC